MWSDDSGLRPVERRHREPVAALVESMYAAGRLSPFDRDLYRQGVANVATRAELAQISAELAGLAARAERARESETAEIPLRTAAERPATAEERARGSVVALLVTSLAATLVALVVVTAIVLGISSRTPTRGDLSSPASELGETHLLHKDGLWTMTRDLDDEFDSTDIVSAVVYDAYAIITRRAGTGGRALAVYRYDGERFRQLERARPTRRAAPVFDLADLDVPNAADLARSAAKRVNVRPKAQTYLVVRTAGVRSRARLYVHASNARGQSGHLRCTILGKVLRTHPAA